MIQTYSNEDFKQIFQSKFDLDKWYSLLKSFFNATELRTNAEKIDFSSDSEEGFFIGSLDTIDNYHIGLFYYDIKLGSVAHKKVGLRNLVKSFVNPRWGEFDAALVVFVGERSWRLSFVCDIKEISTAPKRYTFVFGDGNTLYRTAIERFLNLQTKGISFANIKDAFSVEQLSNEFFKGYKEQYEKFCKFVYDNKADENFFGSEFAEWSDKTVRDYIKKMMGRIVFLYFLQRKGWLGVSENGEWGRGDRNFMLNLFEKSSEEQRNNYLDDVLEPLFFECLNNRRGNDIFDTKVVSIGNEGKVRIPYLNGGLFEKDNIDMPKSQFPKSMFAGLFSFFAMYNFTIDENDPEDAEIGIDPEMLGKIFENLLEDNKDKGAYYTPKEIVQYMCRESLVAYLTTNTHIEVDRIRSFVNQPFDNHLFDESETAILIDKLKNVRICDPAIGSGAFPMGLLNELYKCRRALEIAHGSTAADIKKSILQNNIYGVDIEKGAVDIARLRFWLAIVVDEEIPEPLPNLDFKIMQGDSLLEYYKNIDLSKLSVTSKERYGQYELTIFDDEVDILRNELSRMTREYFGCLDHIKKSDLKDKIYNNILEQMRLEKIDIDFSNVDISANNQFFLWHTWFSDVFASNQIDKNNGFDILIGNPPYIQLQTNQGKLAEVYENKGYKTLARTGDIYCLFYERGVQLLRTNGYLCFITSNKWMRAGYGEKIRNFFANETNPIKLIDFAGVKVFENATVDVNILLLQKATNNCKTEACIAKGLKSLNYLGDFIRKHITTNEFSSFSSWVLLSPIEQSIKRKIEAVGTPLKDWDINIYRGILTGCNEAFIISGEKRKKILANCYSEEEKKRTEELIRPILRGRDIKRYGYDFADLWLIATFPSKHYDIDQFPALKDYLLSFGKYRLEQTGKTYFIDNKRIISRKKTNNKWFETQDSINYWEDFSSQKIIYPNMTKFLPFFYDDKGFMTNQKCFIITGESISYLTAFLNSSLFKFCFRNSFPELLGGTRELSKIFFDKIPVLKISHEINMRFKYYVSDIQKEFTKEKAIEIDKLIFELYQLNEKEKQEIGFIDIDI